MGVCQIKVNNNEESDLLKFYDSDGEFIDYIGINFLGADYDHFNEAILRLFFSYDRMPLTDKEIADLLLNLFPDVDDVIYNPDFAELYDTYGIEYVKRIGSVALIIKE